ncbi:MAG: hypothetical protein JKY03_11885 [Aureispira sp.]|nr:hypothetical protein [Aureispira sp.]
MNEELFLLFCELNSTHRIALDEAFRKSPKMLRLINFLKTVETTFKTPKAIHLVYKEELDTVEYPKLINRFYKLRQQLIEWLYHYLKKTENYSSKEEQRLNFIRYLVNKNQFKNALEKAMKLEKHCRKLNLFELLPGVLNMIIYARQCLFFGGDKVLIEVEKDLLEAIEWHQVLQKLHYYHQQSYRVVNEEGYQEVLKAVRKLIAPYKHLPRFALLYHYIAFSKGCMILVNVQKATNALMRHLNKLEAILKENPQIPMVFATTNYTKIDPYNLLLLKAVFYFYRGQFNQSAKALQERDRIETANPNLPYPISESEIRNTITILIVSKQYRLALKKWEQLVAFYKKHEQEERLDLALLEKANIYFFQYPKVHKKDLLNLYEKLKIAKNPAFANFMNIASIWMQLLLGKVITKEALEQGKVIFESYQIEAELVQELNEAILQKDTLSLQKIIKKLSDLLEQKNNSIQYIYYQQFLVLAKKNMEC